MNFNFVQPLKSYLRLKCYISVSRYLLGKYLFLFHNAGQKITGASAICQLSR